jgi:hypothetical protein
VAAPAAEPEPGPADEPDVSDPGTDPGPNPDTSEPEPEEPPTEPAPEEPEPEEPTEPPVNPPDPPDVPEEPTNGIGTALDELLASLGLSDLPGIDLATTTLDEIWALLFGTFAQAADDAGSAAGD